VVADPALETKLSGALRVTHETTAKLLALFWRWSPSAAFRCLYTQVVADGLITAGNNPSTRVGKPRGLESRLEVGGGDRMSSRPQHAKDLGPQFTGGPARIAVFWLVHPVAVH
jgi:hypothetical protein